MALMWRLTKPLWVTGKMVMTESGFCVLKGLVDMYMRKLYSSAVFNKRVYQTEGFLDIKLMPILNKNKINHNDCHSGNFKGVDFE